MADLKADQIQTQQARQEFRMLLGLEQANLLEISEEEFQRLIVEVEKTPLFIRLYHREKLIRYQRFPQTDISLSFYPLHEKVIAHKGSMDVESLLLQDETIVERIRELGAEKFKQYFLYPEKAMSPEEIAEECGLELPEVMKINDLVNELSLKSEFYYPSSLDSGGVHYSKIASVERDADGFILIYFAPSHARGRYIIDYERFATMVDQGCFAPDEVREIRRLFKELELLNRRKDTIYRILNNIVEKQSLYFHSGNPKALLPYSQREMAKRLGVSPSTISRAIKGKSLDCQWGEKPLKDFFPTPKRFKKELLRQALQEGQLSDEGIRLMMRDKLGVSLSRRYIAALRKELKIPARGKRGGKWR